MLILGLEFGALSQVPAAEVAALSAQLKDSVQALSASLAGLDLEALPLPPARLQVIADGNTSVERNLSEAAPGLLQAFQSAPANLGAAFRLYRDLEAVLAVSQRSAEAIPSQGPTPAAVADWRSSNARLQQQLSRLGDWIESQGSRQFAALNQHSAPPSAHPAPAPKTLVIQNANGTSTKKTPTIPHPPG